MSCLGERLTALVDGELGHDERDRALAHLALCERCRSEADSLRSLKGRLRGLGGPPEAAGADDIPTPDFMDRLRDMGAPGRVADPDGLPPERPVRPQRRPQSAWAPQPRSAVSRPRDNRPAVRAAATVRPAGRAAGATAAVHRPARHYLAVGAATLVLGLGAASYAAGGQREAPTVSPAFDRFAVEHALISGDVPMSDPVDDRTSVPSAPGP